MKCLLIVILCIVVFVIVIIFMEKLTQGSEEKTFGDHIAIILLALCMACIFAGFIITHYF